MFDAKSFINELPKINQHGFETHALKLFRWQAQNNSVYKTYLKGLGVDPNQISKTSEIPFLPITFFKQHTIKTNDWQAEKVFESSGTSGMETSKHPVKDLGFYQNHSQRLFEEVFGEVNSMHILGLLPSYLERNSSSLISMVSNLIEESTSPYSGFYLNNYEELAHVLTELGKDTKRSVLFGVTFALLDLAEQYELDLSHVTLIETGGMKGRREEITREDLYLVLKERLGFKQIYSEYGMTELLSQAYGENARFILPNTMRVHIREVNDPFSIARTGKTGGVNVIDLANVHTCAFIETQDLGRQLDDGTFEVLGRFDNSELRGCNLLVS
ncbi:MAG: acyl transferase [Cyclobacteriaceae bacterium]|nr:acyl transferase [Cyclobacteriaceae bacterium]